LKYIWNAEGGGFTSLATNYNGLSPSIFDLDFQSPEYEIAISEQRKINSLSEVFLHNLLPDVKAVDFFLSYCKLFGLYPAIDNDNKTIRLLNRNEYYINNVIDVEEYFCNNLEHELQALNFDSKFLNLAYKDGHTFDAKQLKEITGIENGALKLNTGNEFNKDVYDFFKGTIFEPVVIRQKKFDEYGFIREPNYFPTLHTDELSKSKIYNPVALLFANGYKEAQTFEPRLGNRYYFAFVDDSETALNNNTDVYNLSNCEPVVIDGKLVLIAQTPFTNGIEPPDAKQLETITLYPGVESPTFSVDFNTPVLRYFPDEFPTGITIFERYWKNYLLDRYNKNTKVFTGSFWLPDYMLSKDLMRYFLFFRNQYWAINKLDVRDVTKNEPVKLEIVSIQNIENYYNGLNTGYTEGGYIIRFMVMEMDQPLEGVTITVDGKTGVTNASGYADILLEEGSFVWTAEKDDYKTETGTVEVDAAKTVNIEMRQGLYTTAEITDLIENQGYIPVATGAELNEIRATSNVTKTMGAGTIWEGSYTFKNDSKFVQVKAVSLASYQTGSGWLPIGFAGTGNFFSGTYDGNELKITDLKIDRTGGSFQGLFGVASNAKLKNIIIPDANIKTNAAYCGILVAYYANPSGTGLIDNIKTSGIIEGVSYVGGVVGANFDVSGGVVSGAPITNCVADVEIIASASYVGGITGYSRGASSKIEQCKTSGSITNTQVASDAIGFYGGIAGESFTTVKQCTSSMNITCKRVRTVGGILGRISTGTVTECESSGTIQTHQLVSGLVGYSNGGNINNCRNNSNVVIDDEYTYGGLAAKHGAGVCSYIDASGTITNCFSIGTVTVINPRGGATYVTNGMAWGTGGASASNSYWDTTTSGIAGLTSGGLGIAKTTTELKADPIGLGIYAAWSTDIWGKEIAEYPELKNMPQ
jgi:hypothetical protein